MILATPAVAVLLVQPPLERLLASLDGGGEETRIVGGAVRNALLGEPVGDIDLATTLSPEEVAQRARAAGLKPVPTGIEHGTMTVVVDGTAFEVTTLRHDIETDGRRAKVRFGRDFDADARRRDFTINALSLDRAGHLHDPVGGLADLAARRVRFIGDPAIRIREDYLRILRLFRFYAAYGEGPLDAAALAAAIGGRDGLPRLSRERVRAEFLKLLAAPRAPAAVAIMADAGLLGLVTGGVADHGRLRRAVAAEAERGIPADGVLRLGALGVAIVEDADRLRERLRLSNAEHGRLAALGGLLPRLRGAPAPLDRRAIRRLAVDHGLGGLDDAIAILDGEPRPELTEDGRAALHRLRAAEEPLPVLPFGGADVVAAGIPKGPRVGAVLERARTLWLDADCPDTPAAVADLLARALRETSADSRA